MEIAGKVFIVTGGASGLGEGTARMLVANGGKVVIADLQEDKGEALAAEFGAGKAVFVKCDVSQEADAQAAVQRATAFGKLVGLVNCAGIAPAAKTVGKEGPHALGLFSKVVTVNLIGTFNMIRLAAEAMAKNEPEPTGERGVLISTASVAAYDGQIGQAAYSASKGGVVGMTLPVARDLARTQRHPQHDDRPGHLRHADAVRDAQGRAGRPGRRRALPEPPGHARRLREARAPDRHQRHAQRRGDPPRRRDPAGAEVTAGRK
jgi:NAD(P)-dependent dehydrogenase (short-subunit alcohol dehydrogenase family)